MSDDIEYCDLNLHDTDDINDNFIDNPLHLFCQEIELAIKIAPNQIWGISTGIDLKRFLYNRYVTITSMKSEIKNFITNNCAHSSLFEYKITVEPIKQSGKELIYIVFSIYVDNINGNDERTEFLQKFLLGSE